MDTCLIKNHLYFHLPKQIEMWGPPEGWDSAPSESHHKSKIKGPSKNTQLNATTLIKQTAKRQAEKKFLELTTSCLPKPTAFVKAHQSAIRGGAKFTITKPHGQNVPVMKWASSHNELVKPKFPTDVLQYCSDLLLSDTVPTVDGFTEHNRTVGDVTFKSVPIHHS